MSDGIYMSISKWMLALSNSHRHTRNDDKMLIDSLRQEDNSHLVSNKSKYKPIGLFGKPISGH